MRRAAQPRGRDHVIRLAHGRRLGYSEYGAPEGFPVLSCHGGLLCRTDVAPADGAARGLGVRILSPDRPGIGLSDGRPGRSTLDWASDAAELADRLGLDRFAVMGWSLGGQYAAAVARALPGRVTRAAIIAGCLPVGEPGRWHELNPFDRTLSRLCLRAPAAARALFAAGSGAARLLPGPQTRSLAEGLRGTRGVVEEYLAFLRPWGFRLEEVAVPVDVWQGGSDRLVPADWAREIARRVPDSTLTLLHGEGHMIGITRRADVVRRLVDH